MVCSIHFSHPFFNHCTPNHPFLLCCTVERTTCKNTVPHECRLHLHSEVFLTERILRHSPGLKKVYVKGEMAPGEYWAASIYRAYRQLLPAKTPSARCYIPPKIDLTFPDVFINATSRYQIGLREVIACRNAFSGK